MGEFVSFLGVMAGVIGVPMFMIFFVPPAAKAFARRIEGRPGPDDATLAELDALRAEVDELRGLSPRLLELEERLDFAERMLANPPEASLPRGGA